MSESHDDIFGHETAQGRSEAAQRSGLTSTNFFQVMRKRNGWLRLFPNKISHASEEFPCKRSCLSARLSAPMCELKHSGKSYDSDKSTSSESSAPNWYSQRLTGHENVRNNFSHPISMYNYREVGRQPCLAWGRKGTSIGDLRKNGSLFTLAWKSGSNPSMSWTQQKGRKSVGCTSENRGAGKEDLGR